MCALPVRAKEKTIKLQENYNGESQAKVDGWKGLLQAIQLPMGV
jgi:hypothetical protein